MRFTYEPFDGRSQIHRQITDADTGTVVGSIWSQGRGPYKSGGIEVWLYGGKYSRTVSTSQECFGFVKGVEAVLQHATHIPRESEQTEAA